MHTLKIVRASVLLSFCFLSTTHAAYRFEDGSLAPQVFADGCNVHIVGKLTKDLPQQISKAFANVERNKKCGTIFVWLDSLGGDIEAAMAGGKIIRDRKAWTYVRAKASCASACALLFLGGVYRNAYGRFGLHRPYSVAFSSSPTDSKTSYDRINGAVKQYLHFMNIPDAVLSTMNRIPPSEVRWLSKHEKDELFVDGSDPVYEDENDSKYAQRLGISKQELYARRQKAEAVCGGPDSVAGSSDKGFQERSDQWQQCQKSMIDPSHMVR